jgi:hypothetical protein
MSAPNLIAAQEAAARGWAVFRLAYRSSFPLKDTHGHLDATADPAVTERWFSGHPGLNLGLACERSRILAIDVDPRRAADDELRDLERRLGPLPSETPRSLTPRGGFHVLVRHPGVSIRHKLGEIELKSRGYIALPPSVRRDGSYNWEVPPDEAPLAPLPERWVAAVTSPQRAQSGTRRSADGGVPRERQETFEPRQYVKDFTGLEPQRWGSRGGKIACPFHPDGKPSFHVYPTVEEGWFCFQCCRGGSVYDLMGAFMGYDAAQTRANYHGVWESVRRFYGLALEAA